MKNKEKEKPPTMLIMNMLLAVVVVYSCIATYNHLRAKAREQYIQDKIDRKLLIREINREGIQLDK